MWTALLERLLLLDLSPLLHEGQSACAHSGDGHHCNDLLIQRCPNYGDAPERVRIAAILLPKHRFVHDRFTTATLCETVLGLFWFLALHLHRRAPHHSIQCVHGIVALDAAQRRGAQR